VIHICRMTATSGSGFGLKNYTRAVWKIRG
jgi:hypothetical protein